MQWFPKSRATAAGFILAGFGGGALVFNQVQTRYINPNNLAPDSDAREYFTQVRLSA